jgi:hypothetical protein
MLTHLLRPRVKVAKITATLEYDHITGFCPAWAVSKIRRLNIYLQFMEREEAERAQHDQQITYVPVNRQIDVMNWSGSNQAGEDMVFASQGVHQFSMGCVAHCFYLFD